MRGMKTVSCARCGEQKAALDAAPVGGEAGQAILASICSDCWAEWQEQSGRLINHYGLVLGDPAHRRYLRSAMKEFLGLATAAGDEPPPEPGT